MQSVGNIEAIAVSHREKSAEVVDAAKAMEVLVEDLKHNGASRVILYGSFARNFCRWSLVHSSTDFGAFCADPMGAGLQRLNVRRNIDADIAVPEGCMTWNTLRKVAQGVDNSFRGFEVDPHFIRMRGEVADVDRMDGKGRHFQGVLPVSTWKVTNGRQGFECLDPVAQLAHDISYRIKRKKDFPEMGLLIPTAVLACIKSQDPEDWNTFWASMRNMVDITHWREAMITFRRAFIPLKIRKLVRSGATPFDDVWKGPKNSLSETPVYF